MPPPPLPALNAEQILARLEKLGIRLGLESVRALLAALGDPQKQLLTILIAGTNGKGSTAALLESMLRATGYRTGLFTSPPLEEVEEQVRVDGRAITSIELAGRLRQILNAAEAAALDLPTSFEALTAAAVLHFASVPCEVAVLEAGMGGARDATNVTEPVLSVITSVDLDHRDYLGTTLAEIAQEKAGVLRTGRPAVIGNLPTDAEAVVQMEAARIGARLRSASEAPFLGIEPRGRSGQVVRFRTSREEYALELSLTGEHQAHNLMLATLAAEELRDAGFERLTPEAVRQGAARCRWPGRMEWIPLPHGRWVLLDSAHNPGGIGALVRALDQHGQAFDLLFGVLRDKDADAMLSPLARRARRVWLTTPPGPRGRPAGELPDLTAGRSAVVEPDLDRALDKALEGPGPDLVVCGSLRLTGEVRTRLRQRFGVPPPARDLTEPPPPLVTPRRAG